MQYLEFTFQPVPDTEVMRDVLSALLADAGFDSFVEHTTGIKAYIPKSLYKKEALDNLLNSFPLEYERITFSIEEPQEKDWNEEWEKNYFQPIVIDNRCVIHSTFHRDIPETQYDIIINPQMAFGTGHHETTSLILRELLDADLEGKIVLDMGCGTSVLAILARMRGAAAVTAIDIDSWCVNNSLDNIRLNRVDRITVKLGDASLLPAERKFDVVIANINRNILLADMEKYVECMQQGGNIYMSGFYESDLPLLQEKGAVLGLTLCYYTTRNSWTMAKFNFPAAQ